MKRPFWGILTWNEIHVEWAGCSSISWGVDRPYVPTPVLAVDHRVERRGDDAVAAPGVSKNIGSIRGMASLYDEARL